MVSVETSKSRQKPSDALWRIFDDEIDTASLAARRNQKIYESVRKLSELIGGEYGDRVVYELLQNAHDAHPADAPGHIAVHVAVEAADRGVLYVANGGRAFTEDNLQAIRNIATSTKEIGEGIGNKGVGFRSIEALTTDARIYSRGEGGRAGQFDGFCFRFAATAEVAQRAKALGFGDVAEKVSKAMPRYLAAVPVEVMPDGLRHFEGGEYVTVVALALQSTEAVNLAVKQVEELLEREAPVLLFLERVARLEVQIRHHGAAPKTRTLTRKLSGTLPSPTSIDRCTIERVVLGPQAREWLVVRRVVPSARVLDAVKRSLAQENGLKSWLEWKGDAVVSLATPLDGRSLEAPRLYTFLPMAKTTTSPLPAHLDAPFFTSIDRRRAKLELPLNAELLDAAAEAAAAAALALAQSGAPEVSARVVTDLVAWKVAELGRLQGAFRRIGEPMKTAKVWPTLNKDWTSLGDLRLWPDSKFKVFTAQRAAKTLSTPLLDPILTAERTAAILDLAKASYLRLTPSWPELAGWAEAVAAVLPRSDSAVGRDWGSFYADLFEAFGRNSDHLSHLRGRSILIERSGELTPAAADVFVRHDASRRSRLDGPPMPPKDVARALKVLNEGVSLRPEVFDAFERAHLWKRYDPTQILSRLPSLFGGKPAPSRRRAALLWAMEVWRHDMAGARKALGTATLHVPTRNGEWTSAVDTAFSEAWTETGRALDAYLGEAGPLAQDAADASGRLLIAFDDWPGADTASKADWTKFLGDAGVIDGISPIPTPLTEKADGQAWSWIFNSNPVLAAVPGWLVSSNFRQPSHPYTRYVRRGEAWRLPGDAAFELLSSDAKKRLAHLILLMLDRSGEDFLTFQIGRFERDFRQQDVRTIRTPLSVFIEERAWLPLSGEDNAFAKTSDAWLMTDRRSDPKFIRRIQDEIADRLTIRGPATAVLESEYFGLKIWRDAETAPARLKALAAASDDIEQSHRAAFRKQYDQAWRDLIQTDQNPPALLAIERASGYSQMQPVDPAARIYVRSERSRDLTRLLIETGASVLVGSGEVEPSQIIERLHATADFEAFPAEAADIQLLADGEPFEASSQDALLVDIAPWFKDAVYLAHELNAQELEKSVSETLIRERLELIRVRVCHSLVLRTANGSDKPLDHYVVRDEGWPVILLAGPLITDRLSDIAAVLSNLIHTNFKSLEPALLRLALNMEHGVPVSELTAPTADDYATALRVDVGAVQELLDGRQADQSHALRLLAPFLVYEVGLEAATQTLAQLESEPRKDWASRLEPLISESAELMERLRQTDDIGAVRRERGLDFARFNTALVALGRPPISHAPALRRQFEAWMTELTPGFVDHLRRVAGPKINEPGVLEAYAVDRRLEFLGYDDAWDAALEVLERNTVAQYAEALLTARVGVDPGGVLPEREPLRRANRKTMTAFARTAEPVLQALNIALPSAWQGGPQEVADEADRRGALDFEALQEGDEIPTLVRAKLWPTGVKHTLDLKALGLTKDDLEAKARARAAADEADRIRRNSISFGGQDFDTTAKDFSKRFAAEAAARFATSDWRSRSGLRQTALKTAPERPVPAPGGPGGQSRSKLRQLTRPPEPIRAAMGLAGELLAFEWLKLRHKDRFVDTCWASENRSALFPEAGDPRLGFDFRVATSETEWLYEVKATTGDLCEFELTDNEYRVAAATAADRSRRYRILFVQNVFDLDHCRVMELPNPAGPGLRNFETIGRSSRRLRFDPS